MYKPHSANPKEFGSHTSAFRAKPRFGGKKFNNSRPAFKRSGGGGSKRGRGERIDFSRFVKKGVHVEEKPYVSTHTFADFPFNEQVQTNILRSGYIHPRPIQDQAIPVVLSGKDIFGMANTGTGKTA